MRGGGRGESTERQEKRDSLAEERTGLAAERTYAAWMRTGLAGLAAGVGAPRLLGAETQPIIVNLIATLLLSFSLFCFGAAVWREISAAREFKSAREPRIPVWLLILLSTTLSLIALAAAFLLWL